MFFDLYYRKICEKKYAGHLAIPSPCHINLRVNVNNKIKQNFHENCYYFDNGWTKNLFFDYSNFPYTKLVNKNVFDVSMFINIARMTKFGKNLQFLSQSYYVN